MVGTSCSGKSTFARRLAAMLGTQHVELDAVWLDYSFVRVFSRALRRTAGRIVTGEPLYGGNRETIGNALFDPTGIPWWVIRTHAKRRRDYPALLRRPEYSHATVIQLRTPAAAEAFLTLIASHP